MAFNYMNPPAGIDPQTGQPAIDQMQNMAGGGPVDQMAAAQSYTPDQYRTWYQQQFGQGPTDVFMQNLGTSIGAAEGPDGQYSQAQWDRAQQMGREQQNTASTFFPEFQAPTYEAGPAYQAPGEFQYEAFRPPSMEDALNDPGYQLSVGQGLKSIQGNQAAAGLARTGGALKALMDYGQDRAAQQYGDVYNRQAQQWQMNRDHAAQTYAQNYQVGRDAWGANETARQSAYDRNYRAASDAYNARFRGRELTFQDLYNRWNTNVNVQAQLALADR